LHILCAHVRRSAGDYALRQFYGGGDLNWNRVVPGTIRSVIRGERPIIRSDGKYVRDYFYVEDGAAAYMLLAERLIAIRS